ncbi:protein kinase [Achlya hypogyna]|uniref:Protein kinase n=1 Tax=Achlya hypogyna TaxID=1202772 RepID=A0A1V9YL33_ACHHY|nr:protein kinase [Achlya hypogyna]
MSCATALDAFWTARKTCLVSGRAATNASNYCAEPACVLQLGALQAAQRANCSVAASDVPMVLGTRMSFAFCDAACVLAFDSFQKTQSVCTKSGAKTVAQCQACGQARLVAPTLVQACQYNATTVELLASIDADAAACGTAVENPGNASGTTAHAAIYWALGLLAVCICIGLAIYRHLKRKKYVKKDLNYYRKQEGKPKKKIPSNMKNLFLDNDVRLDPSMVDYIYEQEQLSQITLNAYLDTPDGSIRVALKQLLPEKTLDIDQLECFMNEIRIAARLDHPNIVQFVGIAWSSLQDLSMMTAYMARGDLHRLLRYEFKQPTPTLAWSAERSCNKLSIAANVIDALVYLHSMNIIHRDLKAKNVLLAEDFTAHVTDFGVSRESAEEGEALMTARVGTSAWIAPEILRGEMYTLQADLYSFGVLLAELDTLQAPYSNAELQPAVQGLSPGQLASKVAQGKIQPAFSESVPAAVHQIALRCLQFKYAKRPTASQVSMEIHALLLQDNKRLSGRYPYL